MSQQRKLYKRGQPAEQKRGQQYRIENSIYRGRTALQNCRGQQYRREDSSTEERTAVQNTVLNDKIRLSQRKYTLQ